MPQVARLDDLKIVESSGVDHPANLAEGWLVMKGDGMPTSAVPANGGFYFSPPASTSQVGSTVTVTYTTDGVGKAGNPFAPHPFKNLTEANGAACDTCGKGPTAQVHMDYAAGKATKRTTMSPHEFVNKTLSNGARCDFCGKGPTADIHMRKARERPPEADASKTTNPGKDSGATPPAEPVLDLLGDLAKQMPTMTPGQRSAALATLEALTMSLRKEGAMPPDFNRDELTPEALAYVADLEAKVAAGGSGATPTGDPPAADPPAAPVAPPAATPVVTGVDKAEADSVRKALDDEVKKNEALAERIAKMERKERESEFVNKAKDLPNIGGAAEVGAVLLSVSEKVDEATFKELERMLKAANAQMEKGALFAQVGSPDATPTEGPLAEINKLAAAKLAAGQATTIEIAKTAVLSERPDLRDEYVKSQRAR